MSLLQCCSLSVQRERYWPVRQLLTWARHFLSSKDQQPSLALILTVNALKLLPVENVALRGIVGKSFFKSGRSKKMPDGEIPSFRRAAPEKSVISSMGSLDATNFWRITSILINL